MSWMTTGAEFGTMLTGISATTATFLWGRTRIREWRADRDTRRERNWNAYISRENLPTWFVRLVDDEQVRWSERVVLNVVNRDGSPNTDMAHAFRLYVQDYGTLTRPPSAAQWDFLEDLRRTRFGAPKGYPLI